MVEHSEQDRLLNVTDAIFRPWDNPDAIQRTAVIYRNQIWSYRQLIDEINRVGNGLLHMGVEPEDRILLIGYDSPFFVAMLFGAMKIGAIPVPVNTYLSSQDYRYFLEDSRAKGLVIEPEIWAEAAPELGHAVSALKWVMLLPGLKDGFVRPQGYPGPFLFYQDWIGQWDRSLEAIKTCRDDMAFWLYSSGSTGKPKAVVHCHKDMVFSNQVYARNILNVTEQDRLYSASKLYFAYGLGNGSYFAFANGASVVLVPGKVDPQNVFTTIETTHPSLFFGVPTLFNAMLRIAEPHSLPGMRACVSAGEPLSQEIYLRWKKQFGVEILDGIGSTEVLHIYISNRLGQSQPGTTGTVVPGYEVQIFDENMQVVKPGEMGDLYVKGDSVAPYYWRQYQKTRESMVGEWFKTGDKYFQDADGHFVYCGRSDDMIKVGGIWVSPIEVENVLGQHPLVMEAAVIGQRDEHGLEQPTAFVVLHSEVAASDQLATELQNFVKEHLAHYKFPRKIHFVTELPKTATGKIQRYRLRQESMLSAFD